MIHAIRAFASSTTWWTTLSGGWVLLSAIGSALSHEWMWFGRSGSVLTLAGLVLAARSIMREGKAGVGGKSSFAIGKVLGSSVGKDGRMFVQVEHSPETKRRWYEESRDATAAVVGLALAALGTVIWGYGDLVNLVYR